MRGRSSRCWATWSARCGSPGSSTRSASGAAGLRWRGERGAASVTARTIWDTGRRDGTAKADYQGDARRGPRGGRSHCPGHDRIRAARARARPGGGRRARPRRGGERWRRTRARARRVRGGAAGDERGPARAALRAAAGLAPARGDRAAARGRRRGRWRRQARGRRRRQHPARRRGTRRRRRDLRPQPPLGRRPRLLLTPDGGSPGPPHRGVELPRHGDRAWSCHRSLDRVRGGARRSPAAVAARRRRVHRGRHPLLGAHRDRPRHARRHGDPQQDRPPAGPGRLGERGPRRERDRDAPARGRVRADAVRRGDRGPRVGRHLRGGARGAAVLHRGALAPVSAAHPLPARRRRDREPFRRVRAPQPRRRVHDAALPARDRPDARHADNALPVAAARPHAARLRPAPPARPRAGRGRRDARGRASAGPRPRERRRPRHDRPLAAAAASGQGCAAGAASAVRHRDARRAPARPRQRLARPAASPAVRARRRHDAAHRGGRVPAALLDTRGGRGLGSQPGQSPRHLGGRRAAPGALSAARPQSDRRSPRAAGGSRAPAGAGAPAMAGERIAADAARGPSHADSSGAATGPEGEPPPSEHDRPALPLRPAFLFLRSLRRGLARGASPLEALGGAAVGVPGEAREAFEAALRRLEGDFPEDEWGFDEGFAETVYPLLELMYERWWRAKAVGVPNVPGHGRALLVANHAGVLPWDALMISTAILREHPLPRFARFLVLKWAFDLPWLSVAVRKLGGAVASPYNAMRLLEEDHLVTVFPEGERGVGKRWSERYRLQRFGRGGFVEIALRTGAPIVPVAVVGSEEIYPKLADVPAVARVLGTPFFPITPTFPALGPLGAVPLPSRWRIEFCEPIETAHLGPEAAEDRQLVLELSEQVRETVQEHLLEGVFERGAPFL